MSYSFSARGATKADVMSKVAAELDKVVAAQSIHRDDRDQAKATAEAFLGLIEAKPSENEEYSISVIGSLGWMGDNDKTIRTASVNVSAGLVAK